MKLAAAALALTLLPVAALAQAPAPGEPETIISNAQRLKDELLSRKFVQSLLSPSFNLEGQFAKWKQPVCPHVVGMAPLAAHVVERRIRDLAERIGAPLDRRDPCKPNIVVFVTPEPQATLDALTAKNLLMFVASPRRELTVQYPVQAWYFGYYIDAKGFAHSDVAWEDEGLLFGPPWTAADDTRLKLGIKPDMAATAILVDSRAITGLTLGSLGDYLALMALAQTPATGHCQPAPSIANLFLKNCEADFRTTGLSDADLAMLKSLYETPDEPEKLQKTLLIRNMQRSLQGVAGK